MAKNKTMVRIKKGRENPYVMIDKRALNDPEISWKAKGLLCYLLSLPDDWRIYIAELQKHATDGRDSTASALRELVQKGYIEKEQDRDELGRICGILYTVYEYPPKKPESLENKEIHPETENPFPENPFPENPKLLNNKDTNNIVVVAYPENGIKKFVSDNEKETEHEIKIRELRAKIKEITGTTISLPVAIRFIQKYTNEQIDMALNELTIQLENGLILKKGVGSWLTAALRDKYGPDEKPTVKYIKPVKHNNSKGKNLAPRTDEGDQEEINKKKELIKKLYLF